MKTNGIWDMVRDSLKAAIDNVTDETTELFVIPFTDRKPTHFPLPVERQPATMEGKRYLKKKIDGMICDPHCETIHMVPLEDFYENRVDSSKANYMFLMTDGKNEKEVAAFNDALKQWQSRYAGQNVYGFYVMLHKEAKNDKVEEIIDGQDHLWKVESASININLVRTDTEVVFNVRNDEYLDIPIYGNVSGGTLNGQLEDNDYYEVKSVEMQDSNLRLYLAAKGSLAQLPQSVTIPFHITMAKNDDYTYLVTDLVNITCKNKKEYTLKVTVK